MIRVLSATMHTLPMRTRLPFRYGIVTLREIEHCFVRVLAVVDGVEATGIAADGLAPKWFTKNPDTTIEHDVAEMKQVIAAACAQAERIGRAETVFEFWQRLYAASVQPSQSSEPCEGLPRLLLSFGASLVERALIDAFCRAKGETFAQAVRNNALGIRLDAIHPELSGREPRELLPTRPLRRIAARHTVGLIDPLTDSSAASPPTAGESVELSDDGLPQSLEACIRAYGLTHFKIKLGGDAARDLARLRDVAAVIQRNCRDYAFTLDGNEQYQTVEAFRDAWHAIISTPSLQTFLRHLIFVEQPLHRDVALSEATGEALLRWADRPAIIIDESDGDLDSLRVALARGYVGASHKNCKGVFKGIANGCFVNAAPTPSPSLLGRGVVLSGEDLCNVGPVALTQDLAVMATLGITHVERNGHHYFKGLSMFPRELQAQMVAQHGDLYRWHEGGFATLNVRDGAIDAGSAVDAPFGYELTLDPGGLQDLRGLYATA
jgi:hypothetical protein